MWSLASFGITTWPLNVRSDQINAKPSVWSNFVDRQEVKKLSNSKTLHPLTPSNWIVTTSLLNYSKGGMWSGR